MAATGVWIERWWMIGTPARLVASAAAWSAGSPSTSRRRKQPEDVGAPGLVRALLLRSFRRVTPGDRPKACGVPGLPGEEQFGPARLGSGRHLEAARRIVVIGQPRTNSVLPAGRTLVFQKSAQPEQQSPSRLAWQLPGVRVEAARHVQGERCVHGFTSSRRRYQRRDGFELGRAGAAVES